MRIAKKFSTIEIAEYLISKNFSNYDKDNLIFISYDKTILVSIDNCISIYTIDKSLSNSYRIYIENITFNLMKKTLKKLMEK